MALLAAKFLRLTVLRGESTPFVMELPPYRFPTLRGLLTHTWERTWQYMKKAGTVILGISILLWAMMTYPGLPTAEVEHFAVQRAAARTPEALQQLERKQAEAQLRHSVAGRLGIALEPLSQWAGFDWRVNIALVGGFAAKEVIVSTLGTAYSLGQAAAEDAAPLKHLLQADPRWTRAAALAFLVFIMFYAPCFVTAIAIAKESGSWKWAVFSIGFNTMTASTLAVLIFQIGRLLG
jgi:ferrous iron transport protein B